MVYNYIKKKRKDGTTRDEHRLIMEEKLGRKLAFNEIVHHINGDNKDNRITNLELRTRSENSREHMMGNIPINRKKVVNDKIRCGRCKKWKKLSFFKKDSGKFMGCKGVCKSCHNLRVKELRLLRKRV